MKIGITADCSSCLEYAPFEHKIKITRTTIHFPNVDYTDGIDIKADEFYKLLSESKDIPSTSAPTPQELYDRAVECKNEGCTDVIHFPISFGLSNYGLNLQANADDYIEGVNYHVFDCRTASMLEGYVAHYGEILANKGYTVDEIFAECRKLTNQSMTYFVVDDLQYLVKNGRLNAASGAIGSLLRIKPILILGREGGTIDPFEKVRTHSKAIERVIEIVKEATKDAKEVIFVVQYTSNKELTDGVKDTISKECTNASKIVQTCVTPTIGAHIGCGVMGVGYLILDGLKEKDELKK